MTHQGHGMRNLVGSTPNQFFFYVPHPKGTTKESHTPIPKKTDRQNPKPRPVKAPNFLIGLCIDLGAGCICMQLHTAPQELHSEGGATLRGDRGAPAGCTGPSQAAGGALPSTLSTRMRTRAPHSSAARAMCVCTHFIAGCIALEYAALC